ncbi:MAG: tetratricopeptide repeat protein [Acidobacteriota bacterium]
MNKEQATFGVGGVAFGFMAGFVLAYALMAPTTTGDGPAPPSARQNATAATPAAPGDAAGEPHGDVMALLDDLNARLDADPDNVEVLLELAQLYMRAGMSDQALGYLTRVETSDPGNFQGLMYTAMAYESGGRVDDAGHLLDRLQAEHADHWETYYLMAIHYMNNSLDLDRAAAAIAQLETLSPDLPVLDELHQQMDHLRGHPGDDRQPG